MAKYTSLREYLNKKYYDVIFNACDRYFKRNKRLFSLYTRDIPQPFESYIDDFEITSLHSEDAEKSYITIKATARLDVIITGKTDRGKYSDVEDDTLYRYVEIIIKTKFTDNLEDFKIIEVNHIDERSGFNRVGSSTKNLVPYMEEKHLDIYAERFLQAVYPDALNVPMALPVEEVARKLELTIEYANLEEGTFGRIYFVDDKQSGMKAKTILIDRMKSFINGVGNTKNTIIHECVHWFFHRRFFKLQRLLDSSVSSITCTQVESETHYESKYSEDLRWMEWQANQLAPRILMPEKTTRMKYDELYKWYQLDCLNNQPLIYVKVLNAISDFFGVSKQLAKIRLIQLGYSQFIGINEYLDDDRYSYVVKKVKMNPGDTYRVPYIDFLFATYVNVNLRKAVEEQKILYIDGFLIINNQKYVTKIGNSYLINEYALNSVDECCLKFQIEQRTNKSMDKMYSMCFLCRSNNNLPENTTRKFSTDESNIQVLNNALAFEYFLEDEAEDNELISNMQGTFNEAFKYLYDYFNMPSDRHCAKLCGVDRKMISYYYNGTATAPNYKTVLAICAGFNLRPRVSKQLLQTIRVDITNSKFIQDHVYNMLLHTKYELGLEEWNRCIKLSKIGDEHLLP